MKTSIRLVITFVCFQFVLFPSLVFAQSKPLREIKVGYPLGGSSSYFWVAYRSGSFEKHGLKLEPIYIRGGLMGIQAALSGDLPLQLQGASTVVAAWAQGAKEFQFIGAVGNRLDYVLVAHPSIKRPEDLKGKRIGVSQIGSSTDFIARVAVRRLGLNAEKDVQIVGVGGQGDRWTALTAGQVQASVFQSPFTLKARKAGYPAFVDFSKEDFEYTIAGPVTMRSFIRAERDGHELYARAGGRHGLLSRREKQRPGNQVSRRILPIQQCGRAGRNPEDLQPGNAGIAVDYCQSDGERDCQ